LDETSWPWLGRADELVELVELKLEIELKLGEGRRAGGALFHGGRRAGSVAEGTQVP
jgi:hypothetical protein